MTMQEWNKGKRKFYDKYSLGFPFYHIHPHKQMEVKYLVENRPDWVTHIFVFGSAIATWHFWWKDLDIYLVGGKNKLTTSERLAMQMKTTTYDMLKCDSIDEIFEYKNEINHVKGDVFREGVLVYEKS